MIFLFVAHRFRRLDVGNEVTRRNQNEDADEQRGNVEQDDERNVQLDGNGADIIRFRVEFDESRVALQQHESDAEQVADEQSASNHKDGKPQKRVADGLVACAESLQDANHRRALKNDNQQSANHRHGSDGNH